MSERRYKIREDSTLPACIGTGNRFPLTIVELAPSIQIIHAGM
ncbi:MAG: hypothetical protein QXR17_07305 [Candidatus Bathyarchaeia archaeon]